MGSFLLYFRYCSWTRIVAEMRWLFYVFELEYICVCVCVCVCVTSEIPWLPWYSPVPAKSQVKRRFPLPWSLSCQQHWKSLDLASGFWQSSMMSVSVWLTATRSMMLLRWITLCLLVWLFIYLDLFPSRWTLMFLREWSLLGGGDTFPNSFYLKSIPEPLYNLGLRSLLWLLYFPWSNIKLLINCKTLQKFQGNSFITNSDTVEWNVTLWPISFVCSERVQWSSLHVSLSFFWFFCHLHWGMSLTFLNKGFLSRQWFSFVSAICRYY